MNFGHVRLYLMGCTACRYTLAWVMIVKKPIVPLYNTVPEITAPFAHAQPIAE